MLPQPEQLLLRREPPIDVILLTGFLGSGKTSLLRRLLARPDFSDSAVIVNEFGSEPLDHLLAERGEDLTGVIGGGCLCCLRPGRLLSLMGDMMRRQYVGELPPYGRLVIETSGLADPAPVLESFATDPLRLSRYKLARILAAVDAANPGPALADRGVGARQLAAADILVLTKTDLVAREEAAGLRASLEARTGAAVLDSGHEGFLEQLAAALTRAGQRPMVRPEPPGGPHGHDGQPYVALSRHLAQAFDAARLGRWLSGLAWRLGARLLRLKGLVRIAGRDGLTEIQASAGRIFPFRPSAASASAGVLVVIVEGRDAGCAEAWLQDLAACRTGEA
jgi:G3E family GTPase